MNIDRVLFPFLILTGLLTAAPMLAEATGAEGAPHLKCEPSWHPLATEGEIEVDELVRSLTIYNDDLIAGGNFISAGGQTVNHIARWDGSSWQPFTSGGGIGVDGFIRDVTVYNDDLIAGGFFTTAGNQTVNYIARWDGSAWQPFISGGPIGVSGPNFPHVVVLTVWNGDLIAGGQFATAGDETANNIARWDGSAWQPLTSGGEIGIGGSGLPSPHAMTVYNGDLVVGGTFTTAGGQTVNRIARWDGSAWHPFTSGKQVGVSGGNINALTVYNGDLIAGGSFHTAGGQTVNFIARWDGSAWLPFETGGQLGFDFPVTTLTVYNDDLIVGGNFTTVGGQTVNRIARWDGLAWHPFTAGEQTGIGGSGPIAISALMEWNGDLITGGRFSTAGGQKINNIARWDDCIVGPFEVTASVASGKGSIDPPTQSVVFDGTATFTVVPETGWSVAGVTGDTCTPALVSGTEWQATDIQEACAVEASFVINTYTVTAEVGEGEGEITPASQDVDHGFDATFAVSPDTGWSVTTVSGDTCTPTLDSGNQWVATNITEACAVTANFAAPELRFDPQALDFGDVEIGASESLTTTLENIGGGDASGLVFELSGDDYLIDAEGCGTDLPAGESCDIVITFAPAGSGPTKAALVVGSEQDAAANLQITGNGFKLAAAVIDIDPLALVFELDIGESDTRQLIIANLGDTVLDWSITEHDPWLAADPVEGTVPPDAGVPVAVTVDATELEQGTYKTRLEIASNDPKTPLVEVPVVLTVGDDAPGDDEIFADRFEE